MKSRITIEVNFEEGNQPVIQIIQKKSDDVRDKLIQSFLENLYHTSRWGKILYMGKISPEGNDPEHKWHIVPLKPSELEIEINLMKATVDYINTGTKKCIDDYPDEKI